MASAPQRSRRGAGRAPGGGRVMTGAYARGACPGLSAPMQTGDGLLVRLLPVAPIALGAFSRLCAAARAHGNGTMEISARGSLQVRGLTSASAPLFADAVSMLGIEISEGLPVITDPLADQASDQFDAEALARELRHAAASAALPLAPKV